MVSSKDASFEAVREEFISTLATLPAKEYNIFSSCSSAEDLLLQVVKLDVLKKSSRRSAGPFGRIQRFASRLTPYFGIVDVLVQCDPIHAATVWGGLRLVLQLASNFSVFFDNLTKILDHLGGVIPIYDNILSVLEDDPDLLPPQRILETLRQVYLDIFKFIHSVLLIFYTPSGGNKNQARLLASLVWKPFNVRFDDIIERLKFHQETIALEINLHTLKRANSTQSAIESESRRATAEWEKANDAIDHSQEVSLQSKTAIEKGFRDALLQQIRTWLCPPQFSKLYEKSQSLCEEGTADWFLDDQIYKDWQKHQIKTSPHPVSPDVFGSNVMWVHGNPGCGKTIMAAATIDDLRSIYGSPVWYFFFDSSAPDSRDSSGAYRSILSQILQRTRGNEDVLDKFSYSMISLSDGQLVASNREVEDLLLLCCQRIGKVFLVLDGLDECEDHESLILKLLKISEINDFRAILFSRPTMGLLAETIQGDCHLSVGRRNAPAIGMYLENRLTIFMERRVLSQKTKALEIIHRLVERADGMFLWARLFTSYIASTALSVAQREDALLEVNLPDGLEQMYNRILGLILSGNRASSDLARLVFMWLLYARRELGASELEQALILCRNGPKSDSNDKFNDFESTIIITCAGLVERSAVRGCSTQERPFQLIHTSVREYFLSVNGDFLYGRDHPSSDLQRLIASRAESHFEILKCCVGYMTYRLPAQPLSGNLGLDPNKKDLESAFPFIGYATTEWSSHLLPSFKWGTITLNHASLDGLVEVISNFLHQQLVLMAWIEACYVLGKSPETKCLNQWGEEVLSNKELVKGLKLSTIATEAVQLSQDLSKMHELWGQHLRLRPGCIWEEVTAFNPSSLLAQNTGITVHSLVANNSDDEQSAKPLVKISRTSSDGNFVAVLGVWPSREFDDFYNSRKSSVNFLANTYRYSSCWTGKYERYLVNTPSSVDTITFPLDCDEVQLQIWQSLWQDREGKWYVQFPLAIAPDTRCFTVLRNLYVVSSARGDSAARYTSTPLPLALNSTNEAYWEPVRERLEKGDIFARYIRIDDYTERHRSLKTYLYWIFFDQKTSHICFVDQVRSIPNNLLMLKLRSATGSSSVPEIKMVHQIRKFLRKLNSDSSWNGYALDKKRFQVDFHPSLPLLAISANQNIYLWNYANEQDRGPLVMEAESHVEQLTFSACGKYFVTMLERTIAPLVTPVPAIHLQSKSPTTGEVLEDLDVSSAMGQKHFLLQQLSSTQGTDIAYHWTGNPNERVLRTTDALVTTEGVATLTQIVNTNSGISARRWASSEDGTLQPQLALHPQTTSLVLLPSWPHADTIQPDIILPAHKDDNLRIVLNRKSEDWNNMSADAEMNIPAIVERDPRTLRNVGRSDQSLTL